MIYAHNGTAIKALTPEDVFGQTWEQQISGSAAGDIAPRLLYDLVPFVRRAVRLRANAVSLVPVSLMRGGRDVSGRPEFGGLMGQLQGLLWRTEFAMSLSPYGAYWRKAANAIGANPTPEWLLPSFVWPFLTADEGLKYLRYIHPLGVPNAGHVELLPPDAVVRFWYPSLDRASWPGPPPGVTAQPAGAALNAQDTFIAQYFRRGAIKAVLLQVPPESKQADRDRLTAWWRGVVSGVRNAWRTVVVQTTVTPQVIGDGLKEMNNESLTRQYRQDVAAAFDVPETMLMQGAANYATAKGDRVSFYEETVFPELGLILEAANEQWLRPDYGAELVAHPERTEARQDAQLAQAEGITTLVGKPVMTVDEGRAWLGWDPLPAGVELEPDPAKGEDADFAAMEAEDSAAAAEEDAADSAPADDAAKAYARHPASGQYLGLPGGTERKTERDALRQQHGQMRKATRERHANERQQTRERHIAERSAAPDAKSRLGLVHRQRADLALLGQRHAAERMMLRSLHGSERARVSDRHAAARGAELAGLRASGATKSLDPDEDDYDGAAWAQHEDLLDLIGEPAEIWRAYDDGETKRAPTGGGFGPGGHPRGPDGRFISTGASAARSSERMALLGQHRDARGGLRDTHASERAALKERHAGERATGGADVRERHVAERQALKDRHAQERTDLRQQHGGVRAEMSARHAQERTVEAVRMTEARREATPKAAITRAYGTDPNTSYELRHRLVDMSEIQASNTAGGAINPSYDPRLQPRDRSRQASQAQIDSVARRLNPDALTTDFHQIDKGAPIIDASGNVLSGNGRTLALQRAADLHPEVYAAYKKNLKERAQELGLDPAEIDKMQRPVMVRELMGEHDTVAFAREANSSGTLRMSPMEQAKVDATQISDDHMLGFHVKEDQGIDQALRDPDNKKWVDGFMKDVPANEAANLRTRDGALNQMGLYRAKAAIYTRAFPGEHGERMAESMLESLDPDLKSVQTGISAALPAIARVRAQTSSGARDRDLDLTPDIAKAVDDLARIKAYPKYAGIAAKDVVRHHIDAERHSFHEDKMTPDQERLLAHLDSISRKPTAVRDFLNKYSSLVDSQPSPEQGGLFGGERMTRAQLLDTLLGSSEPAYAESQGSMF
jgi:hypothetical protein